MDYQQLFISMLYALGAVLWRMIHRQRIRDRHEKMGMKGAMNLDLNFSNYMILLFLAGASVAYLYKFITA